MAIKFKNPNNDCDDNDHRFKGEQPIDKPRDDKPKGEKSKLICKKSRFGPKFFNPFEDPERFLDHTKVIDALRKEARKKTSEYIPQPKPYINKDIYNQPESPIVELTGIEMEDEGFIRDEVNNIIDLEE